MRVHVRVCDAITAVRCRLVRKHRNLYYQRDIIIFVFITTIAAAAAAAAADVIAATNCVVL